VAFSDELWESAADVYDAVRAHPFLTGLTDGTLPHAAFGHFVVQDSHYLRGYARALAVLAGRAPSEHDTTLLAQHAAGAIAAEQEMHAALSEALAGDTDVHAPPAPTTLAYTSYLLATCHGGSFAEGMGAVLPCYWIYARVGEALLEESSPDPLYARWIGMYGGDEFRAVVDAAIGILDRAATGLGPAERGRVTGHYRTTSRYEWMFWDAAWRLERWPV
jgi:thiaminase/transcriptional activator TenA